MNKNRVVTVHHRFNKGTKHWEVYYLYTFVDYGGVRHRRKLVLKIRGDKPFGAREVRDQAMSYLANLDSTKIKIVMK